MLAEKRCPQVSGYVSRSWWESKSDHYRCPSTSSFSESPRKKEGIGLILSSGMTFHRVVGASSCASRDWELEHGVNSYRSDLTVVRTSSSDGTLYGVVRASSCTMREWELGSGVDNCRNNQTVVSDNCRSLILHRDPSSSNQSIFLYSEVVRVRMWSR